EMSPDGHEPECEVRAEAVDQDDGLAVTGALVVEDQVTMLETSHLRRPRDRSVHVAQYLHLLEQRLALLSRGFLARRRLALYRDGRAGLLDAPLAGVGTQDRSGHAAFEILGHGEPEEV